MPSPVTAPEEPPRLCSDFPALPGKGQDPRSHQEAAGISFHVPAAAGLVTTSCPGAGNGLSPHGRHEPGTASLVCRMQAWTQPEPPGASGQRSGTDKGKSSVGCSTQFPLPSCSHDTHSQATALQHRSPHQRQQRTGRAAHGAAMGPPWGRNGATGIWADPTAAPGTPWRPADPPREARPSLPPAPGRQRGQGASLPAGGGGRG